MSLACFILWDSYNPNIKKEEGKKSYHSKRKGWKGKYYKEKIVNELIDKFRNYVPDFTLDEVSQSEKYLDILSFLKSIQEFAVFSQP